jgi:ABC-type polysaccharide/polyol phosphate transport system ATPase subunit
VTPAIEVRGLCKTFSLPHQRYTTVIERAANLFRPVAYERFSALQDVDLAIERGSFVGIVGRNGSGKSTLLKLIAGLLIPDAGTVRTDGSLCAVLELGLGFSRELTVRENVSLYGAILGYPRREIGTRVEQAIHFAELERFRDAKMKNVSSGMCMRLGFATTLQADRDILLLDEVLAVGDASFQAKCMKTFIELKQQGKTVVLVSHDLDQLRQLCDRVVLLDGGKLVGGGDPDTVIKRYLDLSGGESAAATDDQCTA